MYPPGFVTRFSSVTAALYSSNENAEVILLYMLESIEGFNSQANTQIMALRKTEDAKTLTFETQNQNSCPQTEGFRAYLRS